MTPEEVNAALRLGLKVIPPVGTLFRTRSKIFSSIPNTESSSVFVVTEIGHSKDAIVFAILGEEDEDDIALLFQFWLTCEVISVPQNCPPLDQWEIGIDRSSGLVGLPEDFLS